MDVLASVASVNVLSVTVMVSADTPLITKSLLLAASVVQPDSVTASPCLKC